MADIIAVLNRPPTAAEKKAIASALAKIRTKHQLDEATLKVEALRDRHRHTRFAATATVYEVAALTGGICRSQRFNIATQPSGKYQLESTDYSAWLPSQASCAIRPANQLTFENTLSGETARYVLTNQEALGTAAKRMGRRTLSGSNALTGCRLVAEYVKSPHSEGSNAGAFSLYFSLSSNDAGSACDSSALLGVTFEHLGDKRFPISASYLMP